ncbi:RepB family plasmid replication initiator protein, partial [Tetragenococcus halophilus]
MDSINDKRKVYHMKDLKKRKVAEHNDLITSVANMDKTSLKMFELAVSCIDTKNPPENNTVYLSKKELFTFMKVTSSNKYTRFSEAVKKMQKQAFFEIREWDQDKDKFEMTSIVPIPYANWNNYNDVVTIRFDQAILPYLINMKTNFTQYLISDLSELDNKYAIILYRWFSMNYRIYKNCVEENRSKEQKNFYKNPTISIEKLRNMTNTIGIYGRTDNFLKKVIEVPLEQINKHTHMSVEFDKLTKGRMISGIQFFIEEKQMNKINEDGNAEEKSSNNDQNEDDLFTKAMQSNFTPLLFQNNLIQTEDMQNKEMLEKLIQEVYPLYDELEGLRKGAAKANIEYVAKNRSKENKTYIVEYLKKSAESYIETLKKRKEEQAMKPKKENYSRKKPIRKESIPD